ncbi:thioredoxin domain-containing protein [Brevibacillus sp. SYP-B805]|uniref:DsbA family protein n=1 Tax=Brevibacillus sp. SYP-B805 TaxID=1578199 RepID=UPI0032163CC6
MGKNAPKTKGKNQGKTKQERQQKQMQRLVWITAAALVVLIALVLLLQPSSSPAPFAYDKLPVLGDPKAPVKIVEFGDFKCPSCQYFSQEIKPRLMKEYIDKGIVSFYYMNYTIIGPDSVTAALAGQAVFHQSNEAFWQFYDALYQHQGNENEEWATPEFLTELARKIQLPVDLDKLHQDIVAKTYQDEVKGQYASAENNGVAGTPALFINGSKFENVFDYEALKEAIEAARKGEQ